MELAIPGVALGLLYVVSNQKKDDEANESFTNYLPNTNIPDKNYYDDENTNDLEEYEQTSSLSRNNKFESNGAYTDKYFHSKQNQDSQDSTEQPSFYSMTGEKVGSDYFKHNNMVPYMVVILEL